VSFPLPPFVVQVTPIPTSITRTVNTTDSTAFRVKNTGQNAGALDLSAVCVGMVPGGCTVIAPTTITLNAGDSATARVRYTTQSTPRSGASIALTARYETSGVSGSGTAAVTIQQPPQIIATPDDSVLTVGPGSPKLDFEITNAGNNPVNVTFTSDCGVFGSCAVSQGTTLVTGPIRLGPVSSTTVTVQISVAPTQQGVSSQVTLTANGCDDSGLCGQDAASYAVSFPLNPTHKVIVVANQPTMSVTARATTGIASFVLRDSSTNTGGASQIYHLTPTCSGVVSCSVASINPDSVVLNEGAQALLDVHFAVSSVGTSGKVVLVAASAAASGRDSTTVTTTASYSIAVTPTHQSQTVPKGTKGQYPVTVVNTSTNSVSAIDVTLALNGCDQVVLSNCLVPTPTFTVPQDSSVVQTLTFDAVQTGVRVLSAAASASNVATVSTLDSVTVNNAPPQGAITILPTSDVITSPAPANSNVTFTISTTDPIADTVAYHITCAGALSQCHDAAGAVDGKVGPLSKTGASSAPVTVSYVLNANAGPVGSVTVTAHGVRDSALTATGRLTVGVTNAAQIIVNTKAATAGAIVARDQCVTIAAGAEAAYECGDLRLAEGLPATTTMNKTRAPTLVYNSRQAVPIELVAANVSLNPGLSVTSLAATVKIFNNQSQTWSQGVTVTFPWGTANNSSVASRIVVPVDLRTQGIASVPLTGVTGLYLYSFQVSAKSGATIVATAADTNGLVVVDRSTSQFGRGWWLDGLEQLFSSNVPPLAVKLWVGGDGNARMYQRQGTSTIWLATPVADRVDTLEQIGNNWYRHLRNGSYVEFDAGGHQVATQSLGPVRPTVDSTLSRRTVFQYNATTMRLNAITLPVASGTRPAHSFTTTVDGGGNMQSLTIAPPANGAASRQTTVSYASATRTTTVTEADGNTVQFIADANGRITKRIDRLGRATTFDYEPTGGTLADSKLTLALNDVGTLVHAFCAGEAIGLPSITGTATPCPAGPVDTGSVRTLYDGPRPDVADTTAFHINQFGEPNKIVDALGGVTRIVRDAAFPLLADTVVDPVGHKIAVAYNNRALVATRTDIAPYGVAGQNAVTTNFWNVKWDKLDSTRGPTGESMHYTYNQANGDRVTQADGRGDTTKVSFLYNTNRQLLTIQQPGNDTTQRDSLGYDSGFGNLVLTKSAVRQISTMHRDAIGRVDTVTTPLDGTLVHKRATRYDVMDRGLATRDIGPAVAHALGIVTGTAPAVTLVDSNTYDLEGNVLANTRTSEPDIAQVAPLIMRWTYDELGRKITQQDPRGGQDAWHYDLASNDTAWTTRDKGKRIVTQFDALNRAIVCVTPGDTVPTQTKTLGPVFPLNTELAKFPHFAPRFTYDPVTDPDATPPDLVIPLDVARFFYDQAGRLDSALNNDARVARSYFPNGALQQEIQQPAAVDTTETPTTDVYSFHRFQLDYLYDLSGRRTTLTSTYPTCGVVCDATATQTYAYDVPSGLLKQITDAGPRTSATFAFGYDGAGSLVSKAASDTGVAATESYQYDPAGRLMRRDVNGRAAVPAGGSVYSDGFTYDAANRVDTIGVTSSIAGLGDQSIQFYNGLGALAAIQRVRNGVSPIDEYVTDAFGNARTHRLWNDQDQLTTTQSFPAGVLTDIADAPTTNFQTGGVSTASIKAVDTTSNMFDQQGNLVFSAVIVDQQVDAVMHPIVTGRGWTWNAYDPAGRLRVTQQSTWQANAQIRTVFIEHRYDALGRQVTVRTRHDLNCDPSSGVGQCLQTVEHYAWDGAQQLAELRAVVVIKTLADSGHTFVQGDDTCTPPGFGASRRVGRRNLEGSALSFGGACSWVANVAAVASGPESAGGGRVFHGTPRG
jgi:hypothetical protein